VAEDFGVEKDGGTHKNVGATVFDVDAGLRKLFCFGGQSDCAA
jgi:hypothetical protein